jgi:peptide-methionine (S)-S-oxide reductase
MPGRFHLFCASVFAVTVISAFGLANGFGVGNARGGDLDQRVPAPTMDETVKAAGPEMLILAGGCFWGVQGVFQHVRGVTEAVAGYDGGSATTAHYETVSTGTTGHAESVRITYDPRVVTFGRLLQIYFSVVTDPTQFDRQYPDQGPQYRSEIFATTPEQASIAQAYIGQLGKARVFSQPIVTQIGKDTGFYQAETYHQNYLTLHPDSVYIATFDLPKIAALKKIFPGEFVSSPVLVTNKDS